MKEIVADVMPVIRGLETLRKMWQTFECQSVALHSIRHVPPHHVLHVLQGLRGQWRVEARPLLTCTTMLKTFFLKYSNQIQWKNSAKPGGCESLPERSLAHCR